MDYSTTWQDYTKYVAYRMYSEYVTIDMIPDNSLDGFPLSNNICMPLSISALLFLFTKVGMKTKIWLPMVCPAVMLLLF